MRRRTQHADNSLRACCGSTGPGGAARGWGKRPGSQRLVHRPLVAPVMLPAAMHVQAGRVEEDHNRDS